MEWQIGITTLVLTFIGIVWLVKKARKAMVKNDRLARESETLAEAQRIQNANRQDDIDYAGRPVGSRLTDRVRKARKDAGGT